MKVFGIYDGPLDWRNHGSKQKELLNRLEYKGRFIGEGGFEISIRVNAPKGFKTDGASVPGPLRGLIDNDGELARGAVGHDGTYRFQKINRALADALALQMWLDDPGVKPWRAYAAYYTLRLFGWIGWLQNKRKNKDKIR